MPSEVVLYTEAGQKVKATDNGDGTATLQIGGSVTTTPTTSGGLSTYETVDQQNGGNSVKGSAGQLYAYYIANQAATLRFVKLYDKATAPTSADTPKLVLPIPASGAANLGIPQGISFANGIGVRACTGVADADNTAPTANDVVVNLAYK